MDWLNYHHLYYFWTVARLGSVAAACKELRLAQPTVSTQLRTLERAFHVELFERVGRGLRLTDAGRMAFNYAEEIFGLGRELQSTLRGGSKARTAPLVVGIVDSLPKLIAYRLLAPALALSDAPQLVCREERVERLLSELSVHALDLVLSDAPIPPGFHLKAFSHLLGESPLTFFGTPRLAGKYRRNFPTSLNGAPLLLPISQSPLRRQIDSWLQDQAIIPKIVGEFEDSALMKSFGRAGAGVFPGPTVIDSEIRREYEVEVIGRIDLVKESYYVISPERRIKHPAVRAIASEARRGLA